MLPCFKTTSADDRPLTIRLVDVAAFDNWLSEQELVAQEWLEATGFRPKLGNLALIPDASGKLRSGVFLVDSKGDAWTAATLRSALPSGATRVSVDDPSELIEPSELYYGWALADYAFGRYSGQDGAAEWPTLRATNSALAEDAGTLAQAVFLARDLVNTPANDMGPAELEQAARGVASTFGATIDVVEDTDLLERGFPAIFAVGQASARRPRLIDIRWGDEAAPKVTLVGKGVCFDTGGLDIKPSSAMRNMKKDMGGAAIMLGLAQVIMAGDLPVRLRLLIPAVENSIAGSAFRPGDVLQTRQGLTVEVGNTDAEGRLVLADALTEADREEPELLIDAATLTGAARVALGTDLPALFTNNDALADDLLAAGREIAEPLWRLPLHQGYRQLLRSSVADCSSTGSKPFGGAITAALFLEQFVERTTCWAHLDVFAWNDEARPGRPKGGEATALRALFTAIERRYGAGGS